MGTSQAAIASISTRAPLGKAVTATHERAGLQVKYLAYISLNVSKFFMSVKKQVVLMTQSKLLPAVVNTVFKFKITCWVCSQIPPATSLYLFLGRPAFDQIHTQYRSQR